MRCSEPLRTSQRLLPASAFPPPCSGPRRAPRSLSLRSLDLAQPFYPDSDKWFVKPQHKIFRMREVDYYDKEDTTPVA